MELDPLLQHEAQFADMAYAKYANDLDINPKWFGKYSHPTQKWDMRQLSAQWLGNVEGKKLLDYGCGMGEESIYFAKLGAQVTAIDVSPVGVDLVLRRAQHNGLSDRVKAFQMDASATTFEPESFDLVHGLGIVHHIGLEASFREVKRVMKPGARGVFLEHMMNSKLLEKLKVMMFGQEQDHTDYEQPLRWNDCERYRNQFSEYHLTPYYLMGRLRRHMSMFDNDSTRKADYAIMRALPPLKYLAGAVVIRVQK
jgi:SAM-dependent methyltransferase